MDDTTYTANFADMQRIALRVAWRLVGPGGDPADLAAEALGRAWVQRAGIREPKGWVATVTARLALQKRRRRTGPGPGRPDTVADGAGASDERLELVAALRALPARQRQIVVLRYLGDLPATEVATTMNITTNTVATQTATAIAALRRHLTTGNLPAIAIAIEPPAPATAALPATAVEIPPPASPDQRTAAPRP